MIVVPILRAPDLAQQLSVSEDAIAIVDHQNEQVVFFGSQMHDLILDCDYALVLIYF